MTSEQNAPEVESHQGPAMSPDQQGGDAQFDGQNVPHGMGQSKSSRRRRRKRKNKGPETQQGTLPIGQASGAQPIGSIQASGAQSQPFQPQGSQSFQAGGQQQNGASSGKRWKKKFRDRDRQRSPENPGNVASGSNGGGFPDSNSHQPGNNSGGFKRKGGGGGGKQQRGARRFVGPMDHSYRAVNGNFADTPPSTMDSHNGNYKRRTNAHGRGR